MFALICKKKITLAQCAPSVSLVTYWDKLRWSSLRCSERKSRHHDLKSQGGSSCFNDTPANSAAGVKFALQVWEHHLIPLSQVAQCLMNHLHLCFYIRKARRWHLKAIMLDCVTSNVTCSSSSSSLLWSTDFKNWWHSCWCYPVCPADGIRPYMCTHGC